MFGGKDKYVSLLSLIKRESPALYDVINELCLDGTFRSQRYQNTFLMPSKTLVKKLEDLVADDNDDEAIDKIRSLLFKKHYSIDDFKTKDIVIGTLQSGSKVLKSPSTVGKHIKTGKKTVYASKNGEPTFLVYEYSGDEFPETIEGKSGGMVLAQQGIAGGVESKRMVKIRDLTKTFEVEGNAEKTIHNYFKAVAGVLTQLQDESDTDSFEKAKFYLSANPILSWFFLTMPGSEHSLVKDVQLDFDFHDVKDANAIIKECINTDYAFDKELFKKINRERSKLISEKGDKASLMEGIKSAYKHTLSELEKGKSINSELASCVDRKVLMDELRFMYDGCVSSWEDVEDTISALGAVDWHEPKKSHILTNDDIYKKHMLKGTESFICGPVAFVKSVYFLYIPLTESIEEQLDAQKKRGSGISGGNPNTANNITFSGGAARKMQSKKASSDMKLASLVKVLSKSQKAALKNLL